MKKDDSKYDTSDAPDLEDPDVAFQKLEILGEGSFGIVYKVLHRESGNILAAKVMRVDLELER